MVALFFTVKLWLENYVVAANADWEKHKYIDKLIEFWLNRIVLLIKLCLWLQDSWACGAASFRWAFKLHETGFRFTFIDFVGLFRLNWNRKRSNRDNRPNITPKPLYSQYSNNWFIHKIIIWSLIDLYATVARRYVLLFLYTFTVWGSPYRCRLILYSNTLRVVRFGWFTVRLEGSLSPTLTSFNNMQITSNAKANLHKTTNYFWFVIYFGQRLIKLVIKAFLFGTRTISGKKNNQIQIAQQRQNCLLLPDNVNRVIAFVSLLLLPIHKANCVSHMCGCVGRIFGSHNFAFDFEIKQKEAKTKTTKKHIVCRVARSGGRQHLKSERAWLIRIQTLSRVRAWTNRWMVEELNELHSTCIQNERNNNKHQKKKIGIIKASWFRFCLGSHCGWNILTGPGSGK